MMKRANILLLLSTVSIFALAQERVLHVKDSDTGEPIPYANVYFGGNKGGYTDEEGIIVIGNDVNRLAISHISYQSREVNVSDIGDDTVLMTPKNIHLKEVVVTSMTKRGKTQTIGFADKRKAQKMESQINGDIVALYVPYDKRWESVPEIRSFMIKLSNWPDNFRGAHGTVRAVQAKLRLDLQLPDEETSAPNGVSLIDGGIIYDADRKDGKKEISLENSILFPEKGIFIVVECLVPKVVGHLDAVNPIICTTNAKADRLSWVKSTFIGKDWHKLDKDGETSNYCLGLKIIK